MAAVLTLVVVVAVGLLLTRVATVAYTMTGMSLAHARFQARSALTGTGFTTAEAEAVVNHPARRRITMLLMLLGGAGVVSVLGTLVLSFAAVETTQTGLRRAVVMVASLAALLWLSKLGPVDRVLRRVIERVLARTTDLEVRDYAALLHLRGEWAVSQVPVEADDGLVSRSLGELRLPDEGVAVLGIERAAGFWVGAPSEDLTVQPGDSVVLYGRRQFLEDIATRVHGEEGEEASRRFRDWHAASPPEEPLSPPQRRRRTPASTDPQPDKPGNPD